MPLDFSLLDEPLLSRAAPDRAADLRARTEELEEGWPTAVVLRVDSRGRFATDPGPEGRRLLLEPAFDLSERPPHQGLFLGRGADGRHLWALLVDEVSGDDGVGDLRRLGAELGEGDAALAAEAVALVNWHHSTTRDREPRHHPGRSHAGWAAVDPFHGELEFPRTDPAVICLVHDGGDQMLLARNAGWPENLYSVLAGFVEAGESLENCVRREVLEEVGLRVDRVRYLGSQPWPFPRSLMVGFQALGDPSAPLLPEEGEISEARWVGVDELREALAGRHHELRVPPGVSIGRLMLESWVHAIDLERERAEA